MTDLPKTYLMAVDMRDGCRITEIDEKAWEKFTPTMGKTRHVIGTNVLLVKRQLWLKGDAFDAALRLWVDKNLTVPF